VHRPLHKFIESHDIIFDEGGPHNTPYQERIVLETDATDDSTPPPSLPSSPTPMLFPSITSCPKHTIHPPISDNDLHYNISSYSHHANITNANIPKPKTYDEAMASLDAAEWLAACYNKMQTWKHLDVYNIVPQPKG